MAAHCFSVGKANLKCSFINFKFMNFCISGLDATYLPYLYILRCVLVVLLGFQIGLAFLIVKHWSGS